MKLLIVDHAKGEYEVTNQNGVQQTPYRSRKVASLVAGYYTHIGYTVIVKKGKKMALSKEQTKEMEKNAARSLHRLDAGLKWNDLHGMKQKALRNRELVDRHGNITDAGRALMQKYPADPYISAQDRTDKTIREFHKNNGANPKHSIKRDAVVKPETRATIDAHLSQRSAVYEAPLPKTQTYVTRQKLIALRSRLLALIRDDTTGLVSGLIDEVETLNQMIDGLGEANHG